MENQCHLLVIILCWTASCGSTSTKGTIEESGSHPMDRDEEYAVPDSDDDPSFPISEQTAPQPLAAASPSPSTKNIGVKGITGSLGRDDVHQIMETRMDDLLVCVAQRPRRLRFVSGIIQFHFTIDSTGQVVEVHPQKTNVGYHELERCLTEVVAQTEFVPPKGQQSTDFSWYMKVERDRGREPEPLDPRDLTEALKKYSSQLYKNCDLRRRNRFEITAYIGRNGRVLCANAVPRRKKSWEKVECVLDELKRWQLPRLKRLSKVTFRLRWHPSSPADKNKNRRRRRHRS